MAPLKGGEKTLLQNPVPAASSHDDEEVEEEQSQEASAVKNPNDPKTPSSDDDEEEDEDEQESDPKTPSSDDEEEESDSEHVTRKSLAGISEMKLEGRNGIFYPSMLEWICSGNNKNMMVGESFLKQGLDLIGELKKRDLEQKWRNLNVEELKLYLRRLELVREQATTLLDAHMSSNASEQ